MTKEEKIFELKKLAKEIFKADSITKIVDATNEQLKPFGLSVGKLDIGLFGKREKSIGMLMNNKIVTSQTEKALLENTQSQWNCK